jgi:STE24 endopeptidase
MNLIAIFILAAIGIDFVLNVWADRLNLKWLRPELPESFKVVYAPDQYRKSQEYLRVNTRFGWITGTFDVAF